MKMVTVSERALKALVVYVYEGWVASCQTLAGSVNEILIQILFLKSIFCILL